MEMVIKIAQFFLCFTIIVGLHEFGHFIVARLFKIRVEKFYIFFDAGFALWKKKWGETEYGLGWLPQLSSRHHWNRLGILLDAETAAVCHLRPAAHTLFSCDEYNAV
ncbi:MAG: site-2 protease family protein [Alistipes sp.]|nr:site-2 protease family protein [Alistipes sp.]